MAAAGGIKGMIFGGVEIAGYALGGATDTCIGGGCGMLAVPSKEASSDWMRVEILDSSPFIPNSSV